MTTEPGTCDAFTSGEPEPQLRDLLTTQEATPCGWILRTTQIARPGWPGRTSYRTEVLHPWLGTMSTFVWSHR